MKTLKVAGIALAVASLSGCSLLYPHWGATTFPTDSPSSSQVSTPTPSDSQSTSASPSPSATQVRAAQVQIMDYNVDGTAGVIDVVAQVTNVAETGGQCTLTVTSGGSTKTQTVKAEANVDTTQCYPMEITLTGLNSGSAVVTVTYRSAGYLGTSPGQAVTIP
ncbi:MAG: hypothetical protein ACKOWK_01160 [Micrococcales bacterium]